MQTTIRFLFVGLCLVLAACVSPLQRDLNPPEMQGVRWGLLVTDMDGNELAAINPDQRFLPASNTKLFTTAAAFRWQADLAAMQPRLATHVTLEPATGDAPPSLVLHGRGDPHLSDSPDCETRCLATLADAVAATGLAAITHVIGDDTWFPDERWGPGWSWEDLQSDFGTATSALSINANAVTLTVTPGATIGAPADVAWADADAAYMIINQTITAPLEPAGGDAADDPEDDFAIVHLPGTATVRVSGHVPPDAGPRTYRLGLDDPALAAATRFSALLQARGMRVEGEALARHRSSTATPPPDAALTSLAPETLPLAALPPLSLADALTEISKDSQNLYAEILLRHLGRISEDGTAKAGLARVEVLLAEAGAAPNGYDFFDGSGLSVYNRVSPRTIVALLRHAATQDWGAAWRETLPIGGVDGSLRHRFRGTLLEGKIVAKTGTLKGTNALSGYMTAASGQTLVFSIIANDRPLAVPSAVLVMDAALVRIAERN
ncbi:D-alanyl-D-alanine carboxypeptidase/D-alanyl-D-alanine endopeptidase [Hyphomonas johnsonii]|uniref:D-alanyl-D-alanine carboxypeptidase/D-alanyl-D-alanine-endopeptidase n=1 Tax=Hyphomonas johnsonii MHS-2 TaxID=1280950 RepID=A0A059FE64_9PROT|nr:D-alanyl-D-alanine carboxypeptidase/D-alanyl-D-alanine-endopeptidase [Hyphomonas johnsonii]KCZ88887.1 D-alanyl-D-alanine carboxypeptidase/D-alanyl-D-alanine-endopeptidase [Hyphomonas johnsonii MHS-2]